MLDGAAGEAGTGDLTPYGCEGSRGCAHPRRDPLPFPSSSVPLPVLGAAEFPRASLRAISEEQQPRAWHFLSHFSPASREQIPKEAKPHLHRLGGAGRPGEGWDWGSGSSCCPMDSGVQLTWVPLSGVRNGSLQVPRGKGWASSSMILLGASSQPSVGARSTRNCLFPQERFPKKRNSPWDGSSSYNPLKLFFYAAGSWCRHTVSEELVGITEQTRNFPQIYSMARFLPHLQLLKARPRV